MAEQALPYSLVAAMLLLPATAVAAELPPPPSGCVYAKGPTLLVKAGGGGGSENVALTGAQGTWRATLAEPTANGTLTDTDLRTALVHGSLDIEAPSIFVGTPLDLEALAPHAVLRLRASQDAFLFGSITFAREIHVGSRQSVHVIAGKIDQCGGERGNSAVISGGRLALDSNPGGIGMESTPVRQLVIRDVRDLSLFAIGDSVVFSQGRPRIGSVDGLKGVQTKRSINLQTDR